MSLLVVASDELTLSRTPTTDRVTPLYVTVRPTALVVENSCCAVSGPSTTTAAADWSSASVRNRPEDSVRERTTCQLAVVPASVVVQLVVPATRAALVVDTAATAWMSGAASDEARAAASWRVRLDAEPKP